MELDPPLKPTLYHLTFIYNIPRVIPPPFPRFNHADTRSPLAYLLRPLRKPVVQWFSSPNIVRRQLSKKLFFTDEVNDQTEFISFFASNRRLWFR